MLLRVRFSFRLLPFISIRQAHLIKSRLEPVSDRLAAGAIILGLVVFMQLVVGFMDSMVGVVLFVLSNRVNPCPKREFGNVIVKACLRSRCGY